MFDTGGLTLVLTLFWLALTTLFLYQTIVASKSGGQRFDKDLNRMVYDDNDTLYTDIPQFWFAVATTVIYIVALTFVYYDYK